MSNELYAFDQMREKQIEMINKVNEAFKMYDYVALECPTGVGKSAIVMSIALQMGESYLNTSSKLLQDQYMRDFSEFARTVKGRNNFECIDTESISEKLLESGVKRMCDKGECVRNSRYQCSHKPKREQYIAFNRGLKKGERIELAQPLIKIDKESGIETSLSPCQYYDQKMKGLVGGHTVFNYKYFFSLFFHTGELDKRRLLCFDEAHNIENEVIDFISIETSHDYYEKMAKGLLDEFLAKELEKSIPSFPTEEKMEIFTDYLVKTRAWMRVVDKYYEDRDLSDDMMDNVNRMRNSMEKLNTLVPLLQQDPTNFVIQTELGKKPEEILKIRISPIETGQYVKPVFEVGQKVLFTSATLLDIKVFANMIGIEPEDIAFIRLEESPFPKENRPIYIEELGEMNYKTMETMLPIISRRINQILEKHRYERGIIHVTSYKQAEYIYNHSKFRWRLTRTFSGTPQSEVLKKHMSKKDSVLLSPSMSEGVDLKDDLSRFQIIVKIPYPDLSNKRTKQKMQKHPSWYQWHTILKLLQMYGRSIRNESDRADTYILDQKAATLTNNRMTCQWFREAIIN